VELEKGFAPFEDQLVEAAKFVAVDIQELGRSGIGENGSENKSKISELYGREEWLLRWLLKKLQAPKDQVPRYDNPTCFKPRI